MANPPNSAQLQGTPTIPPTYIRVRAVVWNAARDRQTHTDTQTAVTNIHFASATPHVKCNYSRPRIALAITEDCVIFYSSYFFRPQIFRRP